MHFDYSHLNVTLSSSKGTTCGAPLQLLFKYSDLAWQLLLLSQSRSRFSPFLDISSDWFDFGKVKHSQLWTNEIEHAQWLELLHFFSAVENLYVSEGVALCVIPTLQELAVKKDGVGVLLPVLRNIFIEKKKKKNSALRSQHLSLKP